MLFISEKKIKVSNRYSRYLSVALAVSSTTCVVEREQVDSKKNSLEEITAAITNVQEGNETNLVRTDFQNMKSIKIIKTKHLKTSVKILEEVIDKNKDQETKTINVQYSFHEEKLVEEFYKTAGLDYETLGYGLTKGKLTNFGTEDEYSLEIPHQKTASEMLTIEEAKETFTKMQYTKMLGTASDVSFEDRRKFDSWIKYNSSLFSLFMSESLTRDVDYGSM